MTLLLLVVLGWCTVSLVAAGFWAAVCAGARLGEQRQREAQLRARPAAGVLVPAPRAATAAREVAHA